MNVSYDKGSIRSINWGKTPLNRLEMGISTQIQVI